MNTSTTSPSAATTPDTTLGWNAMPAYGEVMQELRGLNHLDIHAPLAPEPRANNALIESFWNSLSRANQLVAA